MRLIDADALPHSWQPNCNGNQWFVDGRDIDAAPTVCCDNGKHSCAFYDPTGLKGFEDGCQYGRIRDSYPPDYCCALFKEAQP